MSEKTIIKRAFTNPVYPHGADPWVIRDGDSYYYCYSAGNGVNVNKIESPDKITTEGGVKVYTAPKDTEYSHEYWAPELHKIGGRWYIYVAADDGATTATECTSSAAWERIRRTNTKCSAR